MKATETFGTKSNSHDQKGDADHADKVR
jgi:hypothetical protein